MESTFKPSRRSLKRRHGFLAKSKTVGGRKVIKKRRAKGRKRLVP